MIPLMNINMIPYMKIIQVMILNWDNISILTDKAIHNSINCLIWIDYILI
jgi:hypothetical protein